MEWLNKLQGKIIGLDTAPLIYFIEENPSYLEVTDAFLQLCIEVSLVLSRRF